MLKDESNTIRSMNNTNSNTPLAKIAQINDPQQTAKERTLFCVNINEKCSEDILYELFLQAGPIENIVRKADKNGTLICLITYKHIQSCEYAISLFNGIKLFDKELKVKQSDSSSASGKDNQNSSRYTQLYSNNSQSRDSRPYNNNSRLSIDGQYQYKMLSQPSTPMSLMLPPGALLAQAFSGLSPSFVDFGGHQQHQLNRSWSVNDNDFQPSSRRNSNNFDFNNRGVNQNRRSNDFSHNRNNNTNNDYGREHLHKHQYHDQSRSRDRRSEYQNDRSRSRSPARKRNRK